MSDTVTWALFPWFEESGADQVHPDDLERVREFKPYGVVFRVLGLAGAYTKIGAGDDRFRVRAETLTLLEPEDSWIYDVGDVVTVADRDHPGTIIEIRWHHKNRKPIYRIRVAGKIESKRHGPEDLSHS